MEGQHAAAPPMGAPGVQGAPGGAPVAPAADAAQTMDPAAYAAYYQQYMQYYQQYMMAAQQQQQQGLPTPLDAHGAQFGHPAMMMQQQPQMPYVVPQLPPPPPPEQIPTSVLWVGYLPLGITEDEIRETFAMFGMIEHVKALSQKNCGFVRFQDKTDAWRCVQATQQRPFMMRGQQIKVGWGRNEEEDAKLRERDRQHDLPMAPPSNSVWVGGISEYVTEDDLRGPFSRFGRIDKIRLLPQKKCAFVEFMHQSDAEVAIKEMQGFNLRGDRLKLNFGQGSSRPAEPQRHYRRPLDEDDLRLAPVPEAAPPANKDVATVIETLAKFVHKLGLPFEEKVKDLQKGNPRFEFLFGGTGQDFYAWRKYDLKDQENRSGTTVAPWARGAGDGGGEAAPWARASAAVAGRPGDGQVVDPNAVTLSAAEIARLAAIVDNLKPTQESIKEAKDWIMARGKLAQDVVAFVRSKLMGADMGGGFDQRLFVLYLVNDVLLHSSRARADHQPDYYTPALQTVLADLCGAAYGVATAEDQQKKVLDLLGIWTTKAFYSDEFLAGVRARLLSTESATKKAKVDPYAYQ